MSQPSPMEKVLSNAPKCLLPPDTVLASQRYAGGFGTDLMLKDLGLAQENATVVRATTPLGGLARSLYAAHSLAGNGGWVDFSSVVRGMRPGTAK
jgi:3-hydroxyisobutyrate dehydrogenase